MERATKHVIAAIIVVVALIFISIGSLVHSSGVSPPFTTVDSQSMQHGIGSQIGIIDTGDLMVVRSPSKVTINSYVEGYQNGYRAFGDYGDVIVYERGEGKNPVIHRAILYLEYNEDGTWDAPSLAGYPSDLWYATKGDGCNSLSGTLTLRNMRYTHTLDVSLDLDKLADDTPWSGYVTMGDNNTMLDQSIGISDGPVQHNRIRSVAWIEVPWLGAVKMTFAGKGTILDQQVPNTIPNLAAMCVMLLFVLIGANFLADSRIYRRERRRLIELMPPTPLFPLEPDHDIDESKKI
ncbi:MAG: S26 family signal peptidase [Candidatus Methanoplasma sp.]|jgi:signal peptidase|nr:S26 family signal peptidase [Candidatus Methanoplasma sp.]